MLQTNRIQAVAAVPHNKAAAGEENAMIDGRKQRKDFMSIVYETYKDFAENTSIHGLKYTVKSNLRLYEKIFWATVVLAGLVGAAYMTVLFWQRYTSNPTRTSILSDFAPTSSVPFPAITICNNNRIMASKVEEFIKQLKIPEDQIEIVERAFPQLIAFTDNSVPYNTTDLQILNDVLIKNNFIDIKTVMKKIAQSCDEMLVKCRWNFATIPCSNLFDASFSVDGHCCSFNYIPSYSSNRAIKKPQHSLHTGPNSGLILLLNPMTQLRRYSTQIAPGLKVIIHSARDYPGSGAPYKLISPGRQTHLQISATKIICSKDIRRLSMEQRDCAYPEELSLRHFSSYADSNCIAECDESEIYSKCGCAPFQYSFSRGPVCNITDIACLMNDTRESAQKICQCVSQCEDEFYEIFSTTAHLDYEASTDSSSFLSNETINADSILLYVYFSSQKHTILFRDTITSTIYLLSSFGGVYSLFLGCSFITVVEIIYYCSFRLAVNLKILARIDNKSPRRHINNDNRRRRRDVNTNTLFFVRHENNIYLN